MSNELTVPKTTSGPNVGFVRKELADKMATYDNIDIVLKGERSVKEKGEKLLPMPTPITKDMEIEDVIEAKARYKTYLQRAVFYGATKRTLRGLLGQLYLRAPAMDELPSSLSYVKSDLDGSGIGIRAFSKKVSTITTSHSRCIIWTDYPFVEGGVTKEQNDSGEITATSYIIKPKHFINWRFDKRGSKSVLAMCVFERKYVESDDGFESKLVDEWVVLRSELISNKKNRDSKYYAYSVTIYRKGQKQQYQQHGIKAWPTDSEGNNLEQIPIDFVGAENNSHEIDEPLLEDLADLNIAHYRNSADYEEACFILGQPTPWYANLTETWVDKFFKLRKVLLGSRRAIPLPQGGSAGLLQASPNTMIYEAMVHKEKLMKSLGAKLVENREVQRTATETRQDATSDHSVLATIGINVSDAMRSVLNRHAMFMNKKDITDKETTFVVNIDFEVNNVDPEDRRQLLEEYVAGGITWSEYRHKLRRMGIATISDEEAKKDIDKEQEDKDKRT